jgi:hypothetical protein
MVRKQRVAALVTTGLLVGALLACKKKPEAAPEASATPPAAPAPTPTPTPTPTPAETAATPQSTGEAKLGDVKRYGVEKESKLDEAGVRVTADELKVFNEADTKTAEVATLPKGLLVFRLVKVDDFQLVEFPSGIGQFAKGWVETKGLSDKPEKVTRDAALSEKKTAVVKPTDGGVAPSPSGSAAPAPKPSSSAAPKPSASVAPKPTAEKPPAPPKPDPKKKKKEEEKK